MDCSPPGFSVYGILQKENWIEFLFPSPGDLPDPEIKPASPALTGGFFTTEIPGNVAESESELIQLCRLFATPWTVA